jgi:hypothetical protein
MNTGTRLALERHVIEELEQVLTRVVRSSAPGSRLTCRRTTSAHAEDVRTDLVRGEFVDTDNDALVTVDLHLDAVEFSWIRAAGSPFYGGEAPAVVDAADVLERLFSMAGEPLDVVGATEGPPRDAARRPEVVCGALSDGLCGRASASSMELVCRDGCAEDLASA